MLLKGTYEAWWKWQGDTCVRRGFSPPRPENISINSMTKFSYKLPRFIPIAVPSHPGNNFLLLERKKNPHVTQWFPLVAVIIFWRSGFLWHISIPLIEKFPVGELIISWRCSSSSRCILVYCCLCLSAFSSASCFSLSSPPFRVRSTLTYLSPLLRFFFVYHVFHPLTPLSFPFSLSSSKFSLSHSSSSTFVFASFPLSAAPPPSSSPFPISFILPL